MTMQLNHEEILVLAQTINPSIEYYRELSNQPHATVYDRQTRDILEALQQKLEEHLACN
jgi:hypothetical protein